MIVGSSSIKVTKAKRRISPPKFKRVRTGPSSFIKVLIEDGESKMITETENKLNIGDSENKDAERNPDDFTIIKGVGPATDRLLKSKGILTFDDLASFDLSFLPEKAAAAINGWLANG